MIIGDFNDKGEKADIKKKVATEIGAMYASLDDIVGDPDYQCGIGTIVYDKAGRTHAVNNNDVALHPGDLGMEYIANRVLSLIGENG